MAVKFGEGEMTIKEIIEQQLNPKQKVSTYKVSIQCSNCGYVPGTRYYGISDSWIDPEIFLIPDGTPAQPLFKDVICAHCNCKGFMEVQI